MTGLTRDSASYKTCPFKDKHCNTHNCMAWKYDVEHTEQPVPGNGGRIPSMKSVPKQLNTGYCSLVEK
jgi:hypothetical protein